MYRRPALSALFVLFVGTCCPPSVFAQPIISNPANLGTFARESFQVPLTATGGNGTFAWEIISGSLPPGVSLRSNAENFFSPPASAALTGVATTAGSYNFTLRVTSAGQSATRAFTVKVTALGHTDYWTLPEADKNQPYAPYTFSAVGNAGPVTWSTAGGLPPGMSLSSSGVLSGTPTASGFYNFSVTLQDGVDAAFRTFSLNVHEIVVTTPGLLPNATQNVPYAATINVSGGTPPYTFATCIGTGCSSPSAGLPTGLLIDGASGVISGTPTFATQARFFLTVTDANNVFTQKRMAISIKGSPPTLPSLSVSSSSFTFGWPGILPLFMNSGGVAPFTWSASGLPEGMRLRSANSTFAYPTDAELSGTPRQSGVFNVTITVVDAEGISTSNTFPVRVTPLILFNFPPNSTLGAAYTHKFHVYGGRSQPNVPGFAVPDSPNVYTAQLISGRVPFGMTFNPATFTISGTPLETGFVSATYRFTDQDGEFVDAVTSIFIQGPANATLQINTFDDLGTFSPGVAFTRQLSACCAPSLTWSLVSGTLPPGTSLSSDGLLSGTPATLGTFEFLVQVADATFPSNFARRRFVLTVANPSSFFITTTLPAFTNVGSSLLVPATVTGATGAITWSLFPGTFLPPGISLLADGTLSGTPTSSGQYFFTLRAVDSSGAVATRGFGLPIYPAGVTPPLNLPLSSSFFSLQGVLQVQLAATGGVPPYHYSLTPGASEIPGMRVQDGPPLPIGFTSTGAFIGVLTTPGTYATSIRVTDSAGATLDRPLTVTVIGLRVLSDFNPPRPIVGEPYDFALTPYGGSGNYSWTFPTGGSPLPPGLVVTPSGHISGTPTAAGTYSFGVTLTDTTTGVLIGQGFTLVVSPYAITTGSMLPAGRVSVPYNQPLSAPGCGAPCTWSGSPPGGLTLSSAGVISGTPTFATTGVFTVQVTGSNGTTQKAFSLVVQQAVGSVPPLSISTTSFGPTTVGNSVIFSLIASGGSPPYNWSLRTGNVLPPGITLYESGEGVNSSLAAGVGYLQGRAMQVGIYTFTLDVTDAAGTTASRTFTWNVSGLSLSNQYSSLPLTGTTLRYNAAYTQPLLVIGGTSRYTWTALGPMPPGLNLNATTGVVSGTPTNTGSFNTPIQVTDDAGNLITATIFFNISSPTGTTLGFSSSLNRGVFFLGTSTSFTVTPTGGTAPYTVTALSPLPPGFALLADNSLLSGFSAGTFVVAGTASVPGTYNFTLRAQDSAGNIGVGTFTLTVAPIGLFSSFLPDGSVGVPYSSPLLAFGSSAISWSAASSSGLPPGLRISPSGVVQGTPTQAGLFTLQLVATDSAGGTMLLTTTVRIASLAINEAALPIGTIGVAYNFTLTATGGVAPLVWSATGLPSGLSMTTSGSIVGTPTVAGTSAIVVNVTDGTSLLTKRYVLVVRSVTPALLDSPITATALIDVTVGQFASFTLTVSGGTPSYTWSIAPGSNLPPGFRLVPPSENPASPTLTSVTGVPTTPGVYAFDLIATDSAGVQVRRTFTLNVSLIGLVQGAPRNVTTGVPYAQQFTAFGGTAPYTFSVTPLAIGVDALPLGLNLSPTGLISGTTTETGQYSFALLVQDSAGHSLVRRFTFLSTNPSGMRVLTTNPSDASVGTGRVIGLAQGGALAATWSLVGGSLPPGVVLNSSSSLIGAPATPGLYSFTLRATDTANAANFADHTFSMRVVSLQLVSPPVEFLSGVDIPVGRVGTAYSFTFKVAGGTGPYTFTAVASNPLPVGLSLTAGGILSGTPQQNGNYVIVLRITDASGQTFTSSGVLLTIAPTATPAPLLSRNVAALNNGSVGVPYLYPLDSSLLRGGTPPYTWAVASGFTLPSGLTLLPGSNGVQNYIGGVPTTAADSPLMLSASDASGQTVTIALSIRVSQLVLSPDALRPGTVGAPYNATFVPSGGTGTYTFTVGSLSDIPPGLAFNAASGALSGTPTSAGNFQIVIAVSDGTSLSLTKAYKVTIDNAAGEAPALAIDPKPIQVYYEIGSTAPAPIPLVVSTTSGSSAANLAVLGLPAATLTTATGTTPMASTLNINPSGLAVGRYTGILGGAAPGTANLFEAVPITLTVAPGTPCSYEVSPTERTAPATNSIGTFQVLTGASCQWTATRSDTWITLLSPATGTGPAALVYSLSFNPSPNQRTGSITVNGKAHSITQFGTTCSFVITPSLVQAPQAGGNATINIAASSSACTWTASGLGALPTTGFGSASVNVTIPPNDTPPQRALTATIAGQPLTVNQPGLGCTVGLSPYDATIPAGGGERSIAVTTPAGCSYGTVPGPSWITVSSGAAGVGSGTLVYTVDPNSVTVPRTGTLTIGGQPFQITQEAVACSVTLNTAGLGSPYPTNGGTGSLSVVTNGTNCSWTAASDVTWATLSPSSGTGNATLGVTVTSNAASATSRNGALSIAGQTIAISQTGTTCTYALQSPNGSVPGGGGSGAVGVVAASVCTWGAATNNPDWLTITASGTAGTTDVRFAALANPAAASRTGTLTIAGLTYSVTQAGAPCSYSLPIANTTVASGGVASASFGFSTTSSGCSPQAVSYASWLAANVSSFAGGNGTVQFAALPNPLGVSRIGTIQVGDRSFTVTQLGGSCGFSLNAYGALFGTSGGSANVVGSQSALGCSPTFATDQPTFVTFGTLTGPVNNIFTLPFSVSPYVSLTAGLRIGRINFGGVIFTVKQTSY